MFIIETILIILEQFFIHFPLIFAAYVSMSLMKIPDLSIESAFVFGALCAARTAGLFDGIPFLLHALAIVIASLVGGALVGALSGCLTRFAHFPHLLSSIITMGVFHGINQLISSNSYISLTVLPNYLASMPWVAHHPELCALILIFILVTLVGMLFCHTQIGCALAAFGQNSSFFTHYNVSTTYLFIIGIIFSNALAGLSGYLVAQASGAAEISMGLGKALFCVTSIILGKQFVRSRQIATIAVPLVGGLIYFSLQQILVKGGFDSKFFTMIQSLIVLVLLLERHRGQQHKQNVKNLGI